MRKIKKLEPAEIHKIAYIEGSLNTLYHALSDIYVEIQQSSPAAANYIVEAMGAIDSAVMASVKMSDKKYKDNTR